MLQFRGRHDDGVGHLEKVFNHTGFKNSLSTATNAVPNKFVKNVDDTEVHLANSIVLCFLFGANLFIIVLVIRSVQHGITDSVLETTELHLLNHIENGRVLDVVKNDDSFLVDCKLGIKVDEHR